jgi:hypothetical protein
VDRASVLRFIKVPRLRLCSVSKSEHSAEPSVSGSDLLGLSTKTEKKAKTWHRKSGI